MLEIRMIGASDTLISQLIKTPARSQQELRDILFEHDYHEHGLDVINYPVHVEAIPELE